MNAPTRGWTHNRIENAYTKALVEEARETVAGMKEDEVRDVFKLWGGKDGAQRNARHLMSHHDWDHPRRDPDNCGACALTPTRNQGPPNYAGWLRIWLEAQKEIPFDWLVTEIDYARKENRAYYHAILVEIRTFGLRVVP